MRKWNEVIVERQINLNFHQLLPAVCVKYILPKFSEGNCSLFLSCRFPHYGQFLPRVENPPVIQQSGQKPSRTPLWYVVIINGLVFLLTIQFFFIPRGTPIRPMAWAFYIIVLSVAGLAGILMVLPTLWRDPKKIWPWLVLLLAVTPFPLAMGMLTLAEKFRGFIMEP